MRVYLWDDFYRINGIDGINEAFLIEQSVTHQAKRSYLSYQRANRNGRTAERIGKIGRIRNLENLGKDYH